MSSPLTRDFAIWGTSNGIRFHVDLFYTQEAAEKALEKYKYQLPRIPLYVGEFNLYAYTQEFAK